MLAKCLENITNHHEMEYVHLSENDRILSDAVEDGILSKEQQSCSGTFVRGFRENMEQR